MPFLILQTAKKAVALYDASPYAAKNAERIEKLRQLVGTIPYQTYRGIGREQLTSNPYFPTGKNGELEPLDGVKSDNVLARRKLAEFEYKEDSAEFSFNNLVSAQIVFDLLDDKVDYEIVEILNDPVVNDRTLGFDVGNWWTSYSIIADTFVIPTWHPPSLEDVGDLVKMSKLNENCLFVSFEDAMKFADAYRMKSWAARETASRQFETWQIRTVTKGCL